MPIPSLTGNPPPLVGRERELSVLRQHLDAARAGHGSLVLIGGEAGIGKTALAEALGHEAAEQGALVLTGRCFDLTETPPYGPWLYLFARYRPTDGLPPLPTVFAQPGVIGEVASRASLFNAVLDFFRTLAAHTPLVVVLDDLHWADSASLDLLRFLAQSVATLPLLLLVTYRSDELTRRHPLYPLLPLLVRESQAERIDVRTLTDADVQRVVAVRYRLPEAATDRLVTYLHERAEGNPFFVGELLRTLEEAGVLREADGRWALGDVTEVRVPPLLRQVIDGRVARLGEEARELLAVAAVIGQEVPLEVWAAVAAVDEDAVLDVIERGVAAGLLVEGPDGQRVQFAHALVREALYEGVLATRRRRLHRAVAEALSHTRHPDADAVADHFRRAGDVQAAGWLLQAGMRARYMYSDRIAVDRLEAALALCDEHDLDAHVRSRVTVFLASSYRYIDPARGMSYLAETMRLGERLGDKRLIVYVLALRAWRRLDAQQAAAGLADYLAAQAIFDRLTPDERASNLSDPSDRALAYVEGMVVHDFTSFDAGLAEYLAVCGRFTQARVIGERFIADAPAEEDVRRLPVRYLSALGNCYYGLSLTYFAQGEPERASRAAADAIRYYAAAGWDMMCGNVTRHTLLRLLIYHTEQVAERRRLASEQDAFHVRWLRTLGIADPRLGMLPVLALEGAWDEVRLMATSHAIAVPANNTRNFLNLTLGPLARAQGDAETAWAAVRAVMPDGPTTTVDTNFLILVSALRLGASLTLDAGDLAAARVWLTAHDKLLTECEAVLGQSEGQALWARYHRAAGDAEQAFAHAERALAHATTPRQPLALLAAHRLLGELDTDAGRHDDATAHLDAALTLADACAAPYERALTLLAIAELHAATGATTDAATLLADVRAICTPLAAKPALARAAALLARLAAPREASPAFPAGLSAREVEVLRLVAAGLMNAEVAERLFLSVRTVEQHLRSIYNKIGASSRTAATRFALEQHLV